MPVAPAVRVGAGDFRQGSRLIQPIFDELEYHGMELTMGPTSGLAAAGGRIEVDGSGPCLPKHTSNVQISHMDGIRKYPSK